MNIESLNYYEHRGKKSASVEASTVSLDVAGQVPVMSGQSNCTRATQSTLLS